MASQRKCKDILFTCRSAPHEKFAFGAGPFRGYAPSDVAMVCRYYLGDKAQGSVFLSRSDLEELREFIEETLAGPLGKLVIAAGKKGAK